MTDWHKAPVPDRLKDGRPVRIKTDGAHEFDAEWIDGFVDDTGSASGSWCEVVDGTAPPSWTDGVCWASNEDGKPSCQPTHYCEITPPGNDIEE